MKKSGRCSRADVHELRRACRAAEAAAWLLSSADRPFFETLRAKLRRLRRRAGAVRDIDVARLVLKSLQDSPTIRRDASLVRESLKQQRRDRGKRLLAFLRKHPRGGVERAARTLLRLSKSLGDAGVLRSFRTLDTRVRRLAAAGPRSIEALHTLRIAGKRALLAGEIIRPMPSESDPLAVLVDQIGTLLDVEVTIGLVRDGGRDDLDAARPRARGLLAALGRRARVERSRAVSLCSHAAPASRSGARSVQ